MPVPIERLSQEAGLTFRQQHVATYLQRLPEWERRTADEIAADISDGGNPLAKTVVIIPVAAHQEAAQIPTALAEYGRQRSGVPFTVVLGLNTPDVEAESPAVGRSVDAVETAKKAHPDLDVRTTFRTYENPVIGKVRRDLWHGVAAASLLDTDSLEFGGDTIGLNHDIDLVRMEPEVIRNIQHCYGRLVTGNERYRPLPVAATQLRHGVSPDHPNVSRAVAWFDYSVRSRGNFYESGMVVPLTAYARRRGFDSHAIIREGHRLNGNMYLPFVRSTHTVTSPRRFVERLSEGDLSIWSEEAFSATDRCRVTQDFTDIDSSFLEEIIEGKLEIDAQQMIGAAVRGAADVLRRLKKTDPGLFEHLASSDTFVLNEAAKRADRLRSTSTRILRRVIGLPSLAEEFESYAAPSNVEKRAKTAYEVFALVNGKSTV